jgi:PKD repeat protein
MKKLLRFIALFLAPSLMFVFFNVVLAGSSVSTRQANEIAVQTRLKPWVGRAPPGQSPLNDGPITGLSITHSLPAYVNLPIYFTATITGGTPPSFYYVWSFGDGGSFDEISNNRVSLVSYTYTATSTYTVVVTASDFFGGFATESISLTVVVRPPKYVYLPVVSKDFGLLPDLVCNDLSIDPPDPTSGQVVLITVQMQNQGKLEADGFWVDLYINPTTPPAPGNLFPWQDVCDPSFCQGMAWRISNTPLSPGTSRNLISINGNYHPDGYDPANSNWTGSLPAGTYDLYAYVDSIDNPVLKNTDGAVLESDEANNRCQMLDLVVLPFSPLEVDGPRPNKSSVRPTP